MGIIDHHGLYVGGSSVIENHPNHGVRVTTLNEFLQGRKLIKIKRFPGNDGGRNEGVSMAYKMIGTPYNVWDFNCEHLVNVIHKEGLRSAQAETAKGIFFGLLALGLLIVVTKGD